MNIEFQILDDRWLDKEYNWEELARRSFEMCTHMLDFGILSECEVSMVLTNDPHIQELNKTYRGKDKPTNVLSFPLQEDLNTLATGDMLGDIILSFETVLNEAIDQDKKFEHHAAHLMIHGFLHLLGYDHETDEEADEMEKIEIDILKALDIKNPYDVV